MMNRQNLCMGCMKDKGDSVICPFCGHSNDKREQPPYLNTGITMMSRYVIGKVLRKCGDSVVYIGFDLEQKCAVEIREFFPLSLCNRNCSTGEILINAGAEPVYNRYLASFLETSRAVARLRDLSGIVKIFNIFEFNHSAYIITEHINGITLRGYIEKKGSMPYNTASKLFIPLVSTLVSAHSLGVFHYGISPDTLYITSDGKLKLPDFSVADAHCVGGGVKPTLYDGYSAVEQYSADGKRGSQTDVYSLCAVLFFMLTAKNPPSAVQRVTNPSLTIPKELVQSIPVYAVSAIAGGLQVSPEQRIETVERLKSSLTVKSQPVSSSGSSSSNRATGFSGSATQSIPTTASSSAGKKSSAVGGFMGKITAFLEEKLNWDENKRTNIKYGIISCVVSFVILGLIAYALFSMLFTGNENQDGEDVISDIQSTESGDDVSSLVPDESVLYDVPDLVNKEYDEAVSDYSMFNIIIIEQVYDDSVAEGKIVSQNVEVGTQCAHGSPIGVTVSKGASKVKIPAIVGKSVSEADDILTAAGLYLGMQTEEYSDTVQSGYIISISGGFKEGDKIDNGSYVNLVVSKGPEPAE